MEKNSDHLRKTDSLIKVWSSRNTQIASINVSDSLRNSITLPTDSLKLKIESQKKQLLTKLDSLKKAGDSVTVEKYRKRLDSLQRFSSKIIGSLSDKQEVWRDKTGVQINLVSDSIKQMQSSATAKLEKIKIAGANASGALPTQQLPTSLEGTESLGINSLPVGSTTNLSTGVHLPSVASVEIPTQTLPSFNNSFPALPKEVQGINQHTEKVIAVTNETKELVDKHQQIGTNVEEISKTGLNQAEKLPELIEKEGKNFSEVQQLERQKAEAEKQLKLEKELLEKYKNEQAIKAEIEEKVKEMATSSMEILQEKSSAKLREMNKIKRKFSEVPDIRYLPKRAPNTMKGLPWRERVLIGFTLQTILRTKTWIEIAPQVSYKLNGKWTVGAGWVYRFSMDASKLAFNDFGILNGQTLFTQYHAFKGFFLRAELEHAQWKPWSIMIQESKRTDVLLGAVGIGKAFNFSERVKGNVLTLYHYAWQSPDPYQSVIEIRFGFDFSLKPKKKEAWKEKLKQLEKASK